MSSQVAVVIGAGALGRATAAILADSGLTVVAVDRTGGGSSSSTSRSR
jgi:2-polyprenyl-6-methoxyphenol hydroxylase-like FAD-dependent oxidoreductase